jgi:uroporphyrinogen-III synthase
MPDPPLPLQDRRIVVTRAGEAGTAFAARLRALGAVPLLFPAITIAPPADPGPLDAALAGLAGYDWLLFTSANGVRAFLARLRATGRDLPPSAALRVGAVGPATAAALAAAGRAPDLVPAEQTAGGLAAALGAVAGAAVLFPAADIARPDLADGLRERGARVDVVTAYRTLPAAPEDGAALAGELRAGTIDAVTFTSPSTVRGFLAMVAHGRLDAAALVASAGRPAIVCIGPTTAGAARAAGLPVAAVAATQSADGLLAALLAHFATPARLAETLVDM